MGGTSSGTGSSAGAGLEAVAQALDDVRAGRIGTTEFVQVLRAVGPWPDRLPMRYTDVLNSLLDRLESSALFSEESCSFSQRDLLDSVGVWLDKARAVLQTP